MRKIDNMVLHVADNVISRPLLEQAYSWCVSSSGAGWRFGDIADSNYEASKPYWGATLLSADRHKTDDARDIRDTPPIIQEIWSTLEPRFLPVRFGIDNIFLNGQTYGLDSAIHEDTPGEGEGWYTALFYLNPQWSVDYGGETLFYNQDRTEIICAVVPKPGRMAFFDGRHPHWGRSPNRVFTDLRVTLSFHLKRLVDSPVP